MNTERETRIRIIKRSLEIHQEHLAWMTGEHMLYCMERTIKTIADLQDQLNKLERELLDEQHEEVKHEAIKSN